jgi:hypothetical protein
LQHCPTEIVRIAVNVGQVLSEVETVCHSEDGQQLALVILVASKSSGDLVSGRGNLQLFISSTVLLFFFNFLRNTPALTVLLFTVL